MSKKKIKTKYYLKQEGKVIEISHQEYSEFKKLLKTQGKKYMCSDCRVCDCEKIKYTNINVCDEVDLGLFINKIYEIEVDGRKRLVNDETFDVYDCKRFEPFKDVIIKKENMIKHEILLIDTEILQLEDELSNKLDSEKETKLRKLKHLKEDKLKLIHDDNVLAKLKQQESILSYNYNEETNKTLKLTSDNK